MALKLMMVIPSPVLLFVYPSIPVSGSQGDEFQAQGLIEPVVPKDREAAVKVTFPRADD
jgi:hypothetical protein